VTEQRISRTEQAEAVAAARSADQGQVSTRAIRVVVILLFVNLALSAVFAGLTLLFHQSILDYQLPRHLGAAPDAHDQQAIRQQLSITLWTRPIPIVIVAVVYLWVARQLHRGSRRAYLRVRLVSVGGLLAVGYLLISGEYPGWLRVVQVLQLIPLAALAVLSNRPAMRAEFAKAAPARTGNRWAALTLVVLTPIIAELTLGSTPLKMAWLILLYLPIYGAGVLLIRELVRRAGAGWGSILLLGVAYGLVEEGIGLQSLTSPKLYGAAHWAPRVLGINTAYTELNLVYHAVFSVLIPIVLVELLFAQHGRASYLGRGGLVISGVVAVLGVGLLRVSIPPTEDPGYQEPLGALLAFGALIVVLAILALRVLPRRGVPDESTDRATARSAPSPTVVGLVCGAGALAFLGLLFPFGGADQPAFTHGNWVLVPMLAAAVIAVATGLALRRWATAGWTDQHTLAAITGALVGHTVFGVVANTHSPLDTVGLTLIGVVMVAGLGVLGRRHQTRSASSNS
jgi:hypothetical protein